MTFVVEYVLASAATVGIANCRKLSGNEQHYIIGSNTFCLADGTSWETKVTREIEDLAGVADVVIDTSQQGRIDVAVSMDRIEYEFYERVIAKELELTERFPSMHVRFEITLPSGE